MYRLVGYIDSYSTVLEASDDLISFTGYVSEIMDAYPECISFVVLNDFGTIVARF